MKETDFELPPKPSYDELLSGLVEYGNDNIRLLLENNALNSDRKSLEATICGLRNQVKLLEEENDRLRVDRKRLRKRLRKARHRCKALLKRIEADG